MSNRRKLRVKVRCTFEIETIYDRPETLQDGHTIESWIKWLVEEHECPGTGNVGAQLMEVVERDEAIGVCWACNLKGKNELLEIDGVKVKIDDH